MKKTNSGLSDKQRQPQVLTRRASRNQSGSADPQKKDDSKSTNAINPDFFLAGNQKPLEDIRQKLMKEKSIVRTPSYFLDKSNNA